MITWTWRGTCIQYMYTCTYTYGCVGTPCLHVALPSRHFRDSWKSWLSIVIWDCGRWKSRPCLLASFLLKQSMEIMHLVASVGPSVFPFVCLSREGPLPVQGFCLCVCNQEAQTIVNRHFICFNKITENIFNTHQAKPAEFKFKTRGDLAEFTWFVRWVLIGHASWVRLVEYCFFTLIAGLNMGGGSQFTV